MLQMGYEPMKACNDDGDRWDAHGRCITRRVHELHAQDPAWDHMWQCFELAACVDDVWVVVVNQEPMVC